MPDAPLAQSTYQIRLEWGAAGLRRLAPADLVVLVDVLGLSSRVLHEVESGQDADAAQVTHAGEAEVVRTAAEGAVVLVGGLRNASAVAAEVLRRQEERGERTSVSVIALGEPAEGGERFAVEDLLGAGAVIAALADLGIDHCSPDAAVAAEGFRALRRAVRHLLTASGTGAELAASGHQGDVLVAAQLDAAAVVPVLRAGRFVDARRR